MNIALPPGSTDADWLRAFHAIVPPAFARTSRQSWLPSTAATPTRQDPLADLNLPSMVSAPPILRWRAWPRNCARGRWICTGGGGYSVRNVVPRAWTHLLGIVSGEPIDPGTPVPESWRAEIGESAPLTMSDGADASFRPFDEGFTPQSRVDQAILATRQAVFPELGLDPSL